MASSLQHCCALLWVAARAAVGGGGGEGGGGSEGGASQKGICVALPPKRKLRPWLMQQAALNVICAQYSASCGRSVAARMRAGCGGTGCEGLRGAPHAPRTPMCPHTRTRSSFSSVSHPGPVGQSGCPLRLLAPTSRTCLRTQGRAGACWARAVWKWRRRVWRRGLRGWHAPVVTPPASVRLTSFTEASVASA